MREIDKKVFYCLISLAAAPLFTKAQISAKIIGKYPASVIYRLYQVTLKTDIPEEKQFTLAQYFLKQDSMANQIIKSGNNFQTAMSYYSNNTDYLKTVLSPVELNDYQFTNSNATSQFVKAIKYRVKLKLNNDQINQLLMAAGHLETLQRNYNPTASENSFKPKSYEGEHLTKVLNTDQYNTFLALTAQPKAQTECDEAYALLRKFRLVKTNDTASVYKETLSYFTTASIIDARVLNGKNPEKLDSVRKTYFSFKPIFLIKLDFFNNKLFPKSQFADVLKKRNELEVSEDQADRLFENISKLEQLKLDFSSAKPNEKYDQRPFEVTNLSKVLSIPQFKKYLFYKDKTQATINTQADWDKIKQFDLAKELDSTKITKLIYSYELNKLVGNELYHLDDSPQNAQFKTKTEADKPQILKDLDAALKTTASNKNVKKSLAW